MSELTKDQQIAEAWKPYMAAMKVWRAAAPGAQAWAAALEVERAWNAIRAIHD
jgi:hypothetical protein